MKRYFTVLVLSFTILLSTNISAQSPYNLSTELDLPLFGAGISFYTVSFIIDSKSDPFSPKAMDELGLPKINFLDGIDPKVTQRFDVKAHHTSDYFFFGAYSLPLLAPLVAGNSSRHKMGVTYLIALEGILLNGALTNLTKATVKRPRPYAFGQVPGDVINKNFLYTRNTLRSFFSGHTSTVACNSFLAAKMLNDFYPESKMKPVFWATATVIPAITGYLRVKAGRHFITDVLAGFVAGAAIGIIIPELHK